MEAIFDFKDINRRMNRKPVIAAVEVAVDCPPKLAKKSALDIINEAMFKIRYDKEFERFKEDISPIHNGYDPAKKGSDSVLVIGTDKKCYNYHNNKFNDWRSW